MRQRLGLWLAIVGVALGAAWAYQSAVFASRSGDAAPLYSTRRYDPYGTAALMTVLRERGVPVRTLEKAAVGHGERGTLVQVLATPEQDALSEDLHLDAARQADWLRQGNTVVQFSRTPTDLMRHLEDDGRSATRPATQPATRRFDDGNKPLLELEDAETRGRPPEELPAADDTADLPDGRTMTLRMPMTLGGSLGRYPWTPLARLPTRHDAVVAAETRVGRGRLVVVGAPSPATNGALGDADNLDVLLSLVGTGPVLIDEWSHGARQSATLTRFLIDAGLLPLLAQLAFVAALYVWATGGRQASDDDAPPRSRSAAEQIRTLGFLYARSLGADAAFDRVTAEVHRRFGEALRCRTPDVRSRVSALPAALRDRAKAVLDDLAAVRPPPAAHCPGCGYDLRGNRTGRCPECGLAVTVELQNRINAIDPAVEPSGPPPRPENAFVDALTASHHLVQEIQRERRSKA